MGQEDIYQKYLKKQKFLKDNLRVNKSFKELKKFIDPKNKDAQYYPSAMEEKEKIQKKYNYSKYYNMGYTYDMVKEHA